MSVHIHRRSGAGWTQLSNELLRDPAMSLKARGVLCTLLSHEDGWQQSAAFTARETSSGKEAIWAALRELEALGYVERIRHRGHGGRWQWDYHVWDQPNQRYIPGTDNPYTVLPGTENAGIDVKPLDVEALDVEPQDLKLSAALLRFDEFWNVFGLKLDKAKAIKAWAKAVAKADAGEIIVGARRYNAWLDGQRQPPSHKYAEGWLNGERWNDDLGSTGAPRSEPEYHVAEDPDPEQLEQFAAMVKAIPWVGGEATA